MNQDELTSAMVWTWTIRELSLKVVLAEMPITSASSHVLRTEVFPVIVTPQ